MASLITKLKKANLLGRGGASFPTYLKWEMVKKVKAEKKYIVANGSEGEPGTDKDGFILANYPKELIVGLKLALDYLDHSSAFIFLRQDYYQKYKTELEKLIGDLPIELFAEQGSYLSGEETVVCQEIEKNILRPRLKPPFPSEVGVCGYPTLINNIETFYYIAQIAKDKYKQTRFYTISGVVKNPGVFELPLDWSICQVLKDTKNYPNFEFFVQAGGGASGEILLASELDKSLAGSASLVVYDRKKTDPFKLMKQWIDFFLAENCDKCTPCREGAYRLAEMIKQKKLDEKTLDDLFFVLANTSFCALGKSIVLPFKSLQEKIIHA
jgi:NADH:ubiquinone oxidoreductase subunit F (NADH-binding)